MCGDKVTVTVNVNVKSIVHSYAALCMRSSEQLSERQAAIHRQQTGSAARCSASEADRAL